MFVSYFFRRLCCYGFLITFFLFVIACNKVPTTTQHSFELHKNAKQSAHLTFYFAEKIQNIAYFNPQIAHSPLELQLAHALYPTLTTKNVITGAVEPALAQEWSVSTTNNGETQYTFKLQEAFWSDNSPITAHQVRISLLEALHNKNAYASLLALAVKGGKEYFFSKNNSLEVQNISNIKIDVSDKNTLEIITAFNKIPLAEILSMPNFAIFPFKLDKFGQKQFLQPQFFSLLDNSVEDKNISGGMYKVLSVEDDVITLVLRRESNLGKKSITKMLSFITNAKDYYNSLIFQNDKAEEVDQVEADIKNVYPYFLLSLGFPNVDRLVQKFVLPTDVNNVFEFASVHRDYTSSRNDVSILRGFFQMLFLNIIQNPSGSKLRDDVLESILDAKSIYPPAIISPYTDVKTDAFLRENSYSQDKTLHNKINNSPSVDDTEAFYTILAGITEISIFVQKNKDVQTAYMQDVWYDFFVNESKKYLLLKNVRVNFVSSKEQADIVLSILTPRGDSVLGVIGEIAYHYYTQTADGFDTLLSYLDLSFRRSEDAYYFGAEEFNLVMQNKFEIVPMYYLPFVDGNVRSLKTIVNATKKAGDNSVIGSFEQALYWHPLVGW